MAVQMQQNYLKNDYIFKKKKMYDFCKNFIFLIIIIIIIIIFFFFFFLDKVIYLK